MRKPHQTKIQNQEEVNFDKIRFYHNFPSMLKYILVFLTPIYIFYSMEFTLLLSIKKFTIPIQILNIIFFELVFFLLFFIFRKAKTALRIELIVFSLYGLVDYFILSFRGNPIMPWDLLSLSTALSVANNYNYSLPGHIICLLIGNIIIFILLGKINIEFDKNIWFRFACIFLSILSIFGYTKFVQTPTAIKNFKINTVLFTPKEMVHRNGAIVAFIIQSRFMSVEKPEQYQPEAAEILLSSYTDEQNVHIKPNIIVIMNEAFSDLRILDQYETNKEVMPFIHSLMKNDENTISGLLDVPVLGGNTANTEFEFLTGDTMAFLPQGSVPYQQYIKKQTDSIASHLKSLDYETCAVHPYPPKGWERHTVYKLFGFDSFYSINDFENPEKLRRYVSDAANYEKVKELYENKNPNTPIFIFNVTMQNHSSYTDSYDNFVPDISVDGTNSFELNQYLSLLNKSDSAFKDLIAYFDSVEEPTIIVFFGDHQPPDSVVSPIYSLNNRNISSLKDTELYQRYKVPYLIHANYDIPHKQNKNTSSNFLGIDVLEIAELPKTSYQTFLSDLHKTYSSISTLQIADEKGNVTAFSEQKYNLEDYKILQYYHLFN